MRCIFCLNATRNEPVEHIVPEGLVGHQPFEVRSGAVIAERGRYLILDGDEVCRRCNHRLGRLDAYLQKQLGFLRTFWNPVGTKSGKPATAARHGMYAERRPDGPHVTLNMEKHPVITPDGIKVPPASSQELAVHVSDFQVRGRLIQLTIKHPTRMNKRFLRAIHKIAFELLCLRKGAAFVLDQTYDAIREYVLNGKGSRHVVLTLAAQAGAWEIPQFSLQYESHWPGWLAIVTLASTFYVDLTPENEFFDKADPTELLQHNMVKWSDRGGGRPLAA